MVAGRERHDAVPALFRGELQQGVHRAADLERSGALKVLAFQADLDAGTFRHRLAWQEWSAVDVRADAGGGRADRLDADDGFRGGAVVLRCHPR